MVDHWIKRGEGGWGCVAGTRGEKWWVKLSFWPKTKSKHTFGHPEVRNTPLENKIAPRGLWSLQKVKNNRHCGSPQVHDTSMNTAMSV